MTQYIKFYKEKIGGYIFQVGCSVLVVFLALYKIGDKVGIYFGDEFGYFSVAGFFAGFDWSEQVSHLGYYGIGYGLLLLPAFLLSKSVHQLMTYAVILNCFFLLLAYLVCLKLLKEIWHTTSHYILSLVALFAITYVSNLCHIQMGWSETLNVLLYWLCLYIIYKLYATQKGRYYMLLAFILCFSVMVHMRNIMLAIAGMIVVLLYSIKEKKNIYKIVGMVIIIVCGIIIFFVSKSYIKENLYLNSAQSVNNDISSVVSGFANISSKSHFLVDILNSFYGKTFYIISSTGGIVLFGLYYIVKRMRIVDKKEELAVYLLSFLSFIFSFLLTVYSATYGVRIDATFYARYYEHTIGFLLIMGIMCIMESYLKIKLILLEAFILIYKLITVFEMKIFEELLNDVHVKGFVTLCVAGVSKYWYKNNFRNSVINTFLDTLIILVGIAVAMICHSYIINRIKVKIDFLLILFLLLIIGKNWIEVACLVNDSTIKDTRERYEQVSPLVEVIDVDWNEESHKNIYYYTTGYWNEYMLSCQAAIGKTKVKNIESLERINLLEKIYIILDKNEENFLQKYNELEKMKFKMLEETDQFILYKN